MVWRFWGICIFSPVVDSVVLGVIISSQDIRGWTSLKMARDFDQRQKRISYIFERSPFSELSRFIRPACRMFIPPSSVPAQRSSLSSSRRTRTLLLDNPDCLSMVLMIWVPCILHRPLFLVPIHRNPALSPSTVKTASSGSPFSRVMVLTLGFFSWTRPPVSVPIQMCSSLSRRRHRIKLS